MEIDRDHPDRGQPLLPWAARALEGRGARVRVIPDGDANWIRGLAGAEDGCTHEVVVHGLANLLHELVHAAQVGHLADDHGVDYGLIPFDLGDPRVRRLVWEEMAAAVIACAYLPGSEAAVDAWFAEQIEIQGVFHGLAEDDLDGLRRLLDRALAGAPGEVAAVVERAYSRTAAWLADSGAPEALVRPPRRPTAAELWERYRRRWSAEGEARDDAKMPTGAAPGAIALLP